VEEAASKAEHDAEHESYDTLRQAVGAGLSAAAEAAVMGSGGAVGGPLWGLPGLDGTWNVGKGVAPLGMAGKAGRGGGRRGGGDARAAAQEGDEATDGTDGANVLLMLAQQAGEEEEEGRVSGWVAGVGVLFSEGGGGVGGLQAGMQQARLAALRAR
jgi:hypothetical protein